MAGLPDPKRPTKQKHRRKPVRPAPVEGFTHADWKLAVCGGARVCAVCGGNCGALQPHHCVYAQWLEQRARTIAHEAGLTRTELGELLARLKYDPRNGMPVGYDCHRRHHSGHATIPRRLLPPAALAFAAEVGLLHRVERAYPE